MSELGQEIVASLPVTRTSWTIGELSDEFNITLRTLRFYETKGILKPRRVDRSGKDDLTGHSHAQRLYSIRDRENLMAVLKARTLGFTLEEAKELAHEGGALRLTDEQIVTQLQHLKSMVIEAKAAFLELWDQLEKTHGSPIPGEDVLAVRAA
jgi:DNA-binding transcriptional MerR regulator